jgi:glycosyltransferase involved in cell wall biosynthesis
MPSFGHGLSQTLRCRRVVRQLEERCDVLLVQLTFQAPLALLRPRRPRVYHLFSDVLGMARSPRYRGIHRAVALAYAAFVDRVQGVLFRHRRARVVTNGRALLDHYGVAGRAAVSATISRADVQSASRRRDGGPARVLFVAHLRHEKGLDLLLEAIEELRGGREIELEVIGSGQPRDLGPEIAAAVERGLAGAYVRLLGEIPFGPALFQHFADADVFVLPSRSEGTPRVLIEARAFGCPVVATAVGGIPTSVEDGVDGLLVPPEDPIALAAAIARVLDDAELRARLVENGRQRADANTVEAFTEVLAEEIVAVMAQDTGPTSAAISDPEAAR